LLRVASLHFRSAPLARGELDGPQLRFPFFPPSLTTHTTDTHETLREGVEVTLKQLAAAFERNLLKEIAPAQGDKFDPHQHQAISSIPHEQPANTVVQLLQKGYVIADRTLRPALVIVSAGQG